MNRYLTLLVILLFTVATRAFAGDIVGNVKSTGKQEADQDVKDGKYESRKYKFIERMNYSAPTDYIVYIDQKFPGTKPPEKPVQVVIQKNATFTPHVLPIMVGTTVEWPNHDDIYHNVFSMSEVKPFDLGLYKNGEIKRVLFDKPGRVDVFCSIHTKMNCIILVLENPYFATTDSKGNYRIANLPAGTYTVKAWHERLPAQTSEITVPSAGEVVANFVLGITGLPQY